MNRLILTACLLCLTVSGFGQTAYDIVQKSEDHLRGKARYSELEMELLRPEWSRKMEIKAWEKGREYAMILITAPAKDKGVSFLKRGTEMWNWIPSVERVIKIPPSMMMQSWMGSDFTNDDLVKESSVLKDYTHEFFGDTLIEGLDCHAIKLIPKPEAPVVWGQVIMFVSKAKYLVMGSEYYDEDLDLVSVLAMSEVKMLGGREIPSVMVMKPVDKPRNSTVMRYRKLDFDKPMKDSFFSERQMKRIR